jgi:hypothetical protein
MAAQPAFTGRFVRRTQLSANEYHKNFLKLDEGIIAAVTSAEADKVTSLMSKIYLRLVNAPTRFWEREGVLRFEAESREGECVKAWAVLCEVLGVASATASKALAWLHEEGIIGYFAGKNGVGVRIFLNRASASIGVRAAAPGQKILRFPPASSGAAPASRNEAAFNDSFAVLDSLDSDKNPHAPKNGADTKPVGRKILDPPRPPDVRPSTPSYVEGREVEASSRHLSTASVDEIVERLKRELEPCVKAAATQAATQTAASEMARTREWFETKALPKAVRVAQHETYALLRKHGSLDERARRARADLEVGRGGSDSYEPPVPHKLTPEEVRETAETCVALLVTQGKSIDVTLSEISAEGGGWVLPEDAPQVREAAETLLRERSQRR